MSEKNQAYLEIAKKVVSWIVIIFTVAMIIFTIISVTTMDKNERTVFGNNFYIVRTDSMSLSDKNADQKVHFNAGDIVIIKAIKDIKAKSQLEAGDIIAFISRDDDTYGETITHRIRSVNKDRYGKVIDYTTYGTNTDTNDKTTVPPDFVIGTYNGKIPGVGNFFVFMKTPIGYIVCVLIPFLLIIGYNLFNTIRLFRQYKGEQQAQIAAERAEMEAQRADIEAQRADMAAMMSELNALRQQMTAQAAGGATPVSTPAAAATPTSAPTPMTSEPVAPAPVESAPAPVESAPAPVESAPAPMENAPTPEELTATALPLATDSADFSNVTKTTEGATAEQVTEETAEENTEEVTEETAEETTEETVEESTETTLTADNNEDAPAEQSPTESDSESN